jgi:hypothetical protein
MRRHGPADLLYLSALEKGGINAVPLAEGMMIQFAVPNCVTGSTGTTPRNCEDRMPVLPSDLEALLQMPATSGVTIDEFAKGNVP